MTEVNRIGPEEHSSIVGGSTAGRRIACPGSYKMEQLVPDFGSEEESEYAAEGTALHECMAAILDGQFEPGKEHEVIGREFYGRIITREHFDEGIKPCLEFFDELDAKLQNEGGIDFYVECRCAMPGVDGSFGTSDVVAWTRKRTIIVDWKFGVGVPATAYRIVKTDEGEIKKGNPQLMFYARAAGHEYPEVFGAEHWDDVDPERLVELFIVQPRLAEGRGERVTRYTATVGQLNHFHDELVTAVDVALNADNPPIAKGDHCYFAQCKVVCPLHTGPLLDLSGLAEKTPVTALAEPGPLKTETDIERYADMLATALDLGDAIEPYVREAQKQATLLLEQGVVVPGWKLAEKRRGPDKWLDEEKTDRYLGSKGLSVEERRVTKLITPAAARKLLKGQDTVLEYLDKAHVQHGVSSGHTLAADSDARREVTGIGGTARKLGAALRLLTET